MPPWLDPRGAPGTTTAALQFAFAASLFPVIVALVAAFLLRAEHPLTRALVTGGPWIPALLVVFTWEWAPRADATGWRWFRDARPILEPDLREVRTAVLVGAALLSAVAAPVTARFARRRASLGFAVAALAAWLAAGFELAALVASTSWLAEHTAHLHESGAFADLLVPVVISAGFGGFAILASALAVDAARRGA